MRILMRTLLSLLLGAIVVSGAIADQPLLTRRAAEHWRLGRSVSMVIEQGGVQYNSVSGSTVLLQRAPFTVWIVYTGTPHASLNVSSERGIYDAIGYEWALRDNFDDYEMIMGMAEYPYNQDRELFMSESGVHYLINPFGEAEHRFNQLYYGGPEPIFMAGGRDVESIFDTTNWDDQASYAISELPFDSLYLTLFYSEPDDDFVPYVVDYFKLELRFR